MNKIPKYIIWLVILLIVFPLLKPGYIFSLDQVLNVNWWIPELWRNIYWVWMLSQIFVFFNIPIWVMEKILILIVFILPSIWGYLLLKWNSKNSGILFGVFLLILNPFLYSRFIDGQINVYLSYALYPLFFYLLQEYSNKPSWKNILYISLYSLLLCFTSIHNSIFIFFIIIIFWLFHIKKIWIKNLSKIWLSLLIINLIWIVPFAILKTGARTIGQIDNFGLDHRQAFQTLSGDTNLYFNALALNGYWWEQEWRFKPNTSVNSKWKNVFFILFFIVLIWILSKIDIKHKKTTLNQYEKSLIVIWVLAFILWLWTWASGIFGYINNLMFEYFPFYEGMREPQKWIMFLIIIYAYFWSIWINAIISKMNTYNIHSITKILSIIFLVSVPIIYTPATLIWFFGQISIQQYPEEWKEIKEPLIISNNDTCSYLNEWRTSKCYDTLSFPWHWYMWINFTKKVVISSIVKFFGNNILFGDNIEIGDIYTQSNRPESKIIEKYIAPKWILREKGLDVYDWAIPFVRELKWLWIKNIILLKEQDYLFYEYFLEQLVVEWILERIDENAMIVLYKIY